MEYSVSAMAEILNITKANVAYRLNKLGLKAPHDEDHLKAVQNYLVKDKKPTLWQMVVQKYGRNEAKCQNYNYRWRKLGKPDVKSLDELDDLWDKRISERKEHAKDYKEYNKHVGTSTCFTGKTKKLRHVFDWLSFDSKGIWDEEVLYWLSYYVDCGYKSCAARRLAYLEVLRQHHVIDQDEYFEFKESKAKLKMAFQ